MDQECARLVCRPDWDWPPVQWPWHRTQGPAQTLHMWHMGTWHCRRERVSLACCVQPVPHVACMPWAAHTPCCPHVLWTTYPGAGTCCMWSIGLDWQHTLPGMGPGCTQGAGMGPVSCSALLGCLFMLVLARSDPEWPWSLHTGPVWQGEACIPISAPSALCRAWSTRSSLWVCVWLKWW